MENGAGILAGDAILHRLEEGFIDRSCGLLDQGALDSYDFMEYA